MGTDNALWIDERWVCSVFTPGFAGDAEGTFIDASNAQKHVLLSVRSRALTLGYEVRIDGNSIAKGDLAVKGLWLSFVSGTLLFGGLFLLGMSAVT